MTDTKLVNRLKKMSYNLGSWDTTSSMTLALFVVGMRNVIGSELHNMVSSNDIVFYFVTYVLIFCYVLAIVRAIYCVSYTEQEMKRLGVAVIK